MKFYFDTEFVNGNYYMCDIIDMSLLSDRTGNVFHTYIKQDFPIPEIVVKITGITDDVLNENGVDDFSEAVTCMTRFIKEEIKCIVEISNIVEDVVDVDVDEDVIATFIAHGGFETDFPYFFNNCSKNNVVFDKLYEKALYQDSMVSFKEYYSTPGLTSLARMCNLNNNDVQKDNGGGIQQQSYQRHSSYGDVWLLKHICDKRYPNVSMMTKTFENLYADIRKKMPVDFEEIRYLKREVCRQRHVIDQIQYLESKLRSRTKTKNSAFRNNNISKICKYFILREKF